MTTVRRILFVAAAIVIVSAGPVASAGSQLAPTAVPAVPREVSVPRFHYPVVFALPIVLLGLGLYLGRALTRPVDP